MLTDQELIEGLQAELAPLLPPADLIDRLRAEAATGSDRGRLSHGRRRRRVSAGSVAIVASGLVAIAVAAGALVLAGHRTENPGQTTSARHHERGDTVPTLGQLKANFAVLRRPQTAADRSVQTFCANPCKEQIVPGLTRLARTLPDGTKVFLSVWRLRVHYRGHPAGSYALHEDLTYPGQRQQIDPESLPDVVFENAGGFTVLPNAAIVGHKHAPLWSAIAPDGVSSVRWTFICLHRVCKGAKNAPVLITVPVINNVASSRVPGTSGRGAGRADWYAQSGRQLASFSHSTPLTTPPFFQPPPQGPNQPAWLSKLASRFAVLNTRPTPLPSAVAKDLVTYGVPTAGLRFAHRVVFPTGTVWIIPEPSELCLALVLPGNRGPGGETCSPGKDGVRLSEGQREHLGQPPGPENPFRAHKAGIVTDEVTAVRVYPPNRPPVTIPVKDNAFLVATSPGTPVKLSR